MAHAQRAARIDAPLLNARLSKAQDASSLLDLFAHHGWQMDGMHFGNLWNKLGRQVRESATRQQWIEQHAVALAHLTTATGEHLRTCGAQPLANIAHGAAIVGLPTTLTDPLFFGIVSAAQANLGSWEPRHIANLAWASAQVGLRDESFFEALATAARAHLDAFNPLELGMLAAAYAKRESRVFTRDLCRSVRLRPGAFGPQELATVADALVKLHGLEETAKRRARATRALKRLARAARARLVASPRAFGLQDLVQLASGFARLALPRWGAKFVAALAGAGAAVLREGGSKGSAKGGGKGKGVKGGGKGGGKGFEVAAAGPSRHVANLLWAVAKLACSPKLVVPGQGREAVVVSVARPALAKDPMVLALVAEAARHAAARVDEFNPRDLANTAWALLTLGDLHSDLMAKLARRAAQTLSSFNAQEASKLLYATRASRVSCPELDEAAFALRERAFEFGPLVGTVRLEHRVGGGRAIGGREQTGATAATGGALWEASFVLAEWLSRQASPASAALPATVREALHGSRRMSWSREGVSSWAEAEAVELGAGLGLPSIVAHKLGMHVMATDGDEHVMDLLRRNAASNAVALPRSTPLRVAPLRWGEGRDLEACGLTRPPDVIFGCDLVYGVDEGVWAALVRTLVVLSSEETLVLMAHGNGAAPGAQAMRGRFYKLATEYFECERLAQRDLDPEHPGIEVHCLTRRPKAESKVAAQGQGRKRARLQ